MNTDAVRKPALVLFSGGQDSTTCLYWALREFGTVHAVGFDYGQRHVIELRQAEKIASIAGVPYKIVDIRGCLSGSALIECPQDMNAPHPRDPELPASFVPARNALFLTLAAGEAYRLGITQLVAGMCQADYSGYPDCRRDFVEAMQTALSLALGVSFQLHTPLMDLTKAAIWRWASQLGILDLIIEETHSDYYGDRSQRHAWGYGRLDNPASKLRANGYSEARAKGWI